LHEKPNAVYVLTGAVTHELAHAGNPISEVVISAAATPINPFFMDASLWYSGASHQSYTP
jgi:hypothetical protein